MRDLYPYRLALHQMDAMRTTIKDKDGNDTGVKKWLGRDGNIPEGQAILRAQFEEVEQTIEESELCIYLNFFDVQADSRPHSSSAQSRRRR